MKQYRYSILSSALLFVLFICIAAYAGNKFTGNNDVSQNSIITVSDEGSDYNTGEDIEVPDEGIPSETPGDNTDQGNDGDPYEGQAVED